ncbi:hypothetical protein ACFX1X_005189 [Malus domestica]
MEEGARSGRPGWSDESGGRIHIGDEQGKRQSRRSSKNEQRFDTRGEGVLGGEKIALSGEELEEFEGDETEPLFNFAFESIFPPGLYFDFATENSEGSDLRFGPNFSSGFCLEGEKMAASETGSVLPSTELSRAEPVVNSDGRACSGARGY